MKIYLIEPYFTGSHRLWAEELVEVSAHDIEIFSLEGKAWKWRMRAGAIPLSQQVNRAGKPDLFLTTSLLDLGLFKANLEPQFAGVPFVHYFHETQFEYPVKYPRGKDSLEFALKNLSACLTADQVAFNSEFHRRVFFEKVESFLKRMEDHQLFDEVERVKQSSLVIPCGVPVEKIRADSVSRSSNEYPVFLWNQRWDHDKNPQQFFELLLELDKKSIDFRLILLGEAPSFPSLLEPFREKFSDRMLVPNYLENRKDYFEALRKGDFLISFADHDFFGVSIVEAIASGVYPLLPERLAYPEHVGEKHLYRGRRDLVEKLTKLLSDFPNLPKTDSKIEKYEWKEVGSEWDRLFDSLIES